VLAIIRRNILMLAQRKIRVGIVLVFYGLAGLIYIFAALADIQKGAPDPWVLPLSIGAYRVLMFACFGMVAAGTSLAHDGFSKRKAEHDRVACPKCGEMVCIRLYKVWEIIVAILLFPYGPLVFLFMPVSAKCLKCGNSWRPRKSG